MRTTGGPAKDRARARSRPRLAAAGFCALALAAGAPSAAGAADPTLAGHWPLDGSGADVSGNGNPADVADGAPFAAGRLGQAIDENGSLFTVTVPGSAPNLAALEPARVTLSAWVKDTESPGTFRYLVAKGGNDTCTGGDGALATPSYALATNQDEDLVFLTFSGVVLSPTQSPAVPGAQVFDGEWHHLAGVFDGTRTRLFLDGVETGDGSNGTPSIAYGLASRALRIGSSPVDTCSGHFSSFIDDVRVYSRALAAGDVAALARGEDPAAPVGPPPPQPPTNTRRPSIAPVDGQAGTYRCAPGDWTPADGVSFRYAWRDLVRGATLATSETFTPAPADFGFTIGCAVTATGAGGENTATSDTVFFTSAGLNTLPPAYGNLAVRGIDVFQSTQPNSGAQKYRFPSGSYPSIPGGGTPTSLRLVGIGGLLGSIRPQEATYGGVTLDALQQTTAVVYVNTTTGPAADSRLPIEVTLTARRGGRQVGQTRVTTVRNPPQAGGLVVSGFERRRTGVRFNVPAEWLQGGALDLVATVNFAPGQLGATFGQRECEAPCASDNVFTLKGVPAEGLPVLVVGAIQLTTTGQGNLAPSTSVLAAASRLIPGGQRWAIQPYAATLDITREAGLTGTLTSAAGATPVWACDGANYTAPNFTAIGQVNRACRISAVGARIMGWMATNPAREVSIAGLRVRLRERYDILLASHNYQTGSGTREPGWQNNGDITGVSDIAPLGPGPYLAMRDTGRPLTAAAHEFGHALSAPHAGLQCGGNANGQVGEGWAPDDRGRLQGVQFVQPGRLGRTSSPAQIAIDDAVSPVLYDFMSYCATNTDASYRSPADAWISPFNWNRFFTRMRQFGSRVGYTGRPSERTFALPVRAARAARAGAGPRARTAARSTLGVAVGTVGPAGGAIVRVDPPDRERTDVPSVSGSAVRLRSLAADGRVLLDAGATVNAPEDGPAGSLATWVAPVSPDAATLQLVRSGAVVATLRRGAAPKVRLRAPRAGARLRRGPVTVRWSVSGAAGAGRSASVQFSADGGRSWRTVFDGPDAGVARVRGEQLSGTRDGRLRVIVRDGLASGRGVSGRLRADGRAPQVTITAPADAQPLLAGDRVLLSGRAIDDAGVALRGRALRWFAGRRALGSGERLRVRLPAGTAALRLVARDARGARGTATLRVPVQRRPLRITRIAFPRVVAAGARTVRGRIATSEAATLSAGRRRAAVGPRARTVTLALPATPRRGLVRTTYTLRPKGRDVGGTIRGVVEVVRR